MRRKGGRKKSVPVDRARLVRVKDMLRRKMTKVQIAKELEISRQALWFFIKRHKLDGDTRTNYYFLRKGK